MSKASKKLRDALPVEERAGLKLDRSISYPVYGTTARGDEAVFGWIDPHMRVFQCGGELREIIYLPTRTLSVPEEVWKEILDDNCGTWEAIDHVSNTSYRIGVAEAVKRGKRYWTGSGWRWGVSLRYVDHVDARGYTIPSKPPPPPDASQVSMDL